MMGTQILLKKKQKQNQRPLLVSFLRVYRLHCLTDLYRSFKMKYTIKSQK